MSLNLVKKYIPIFLAAVLIFIGFAWLFFTPPPQEFPVNTYFTIESGESLGSIATSLDRNRIVRSSEFFRGVVTLIFLSSRGAVAGEYYFEKPLNVLEVAKRVIGGDLVVDPAKITIPEGLSKTETAEVIQKSIPSFDILDFVAKAEEGYIFPDTYFFPKNISSYDAVRLTRKNFDQRILPLSEKIEAFEESLPDIIKMASILELEASDSKARKIISGILWNRIEIGMPLQVDVSFKYINGKNSFELTLDDLAIDSPYNSYKYKGLPPTPISNPSLDAIEAAVAPEESDYVYYISDKSGEMHYAKTFEEHKKNKAKYLK